MTGRPRPPAPAYVNSMLVWSERSPAIDQRIAAYRIVDCPRGGGGGLRRYLAVWGIGIRAKELGRA